MTYENELPLPDYDGGPLQRMRQAAVEGEARAKIKRLDDIAELQSIIEDALYESGEPRYIAMVLYEQGYRKS